MTTRAISTCTSPKNNKSPAALAAFSPPGFTGAVLLREVDRGLGLIDAINACIPDPRNQDLIVHKQRTLLAQRIFGIALGYEDLNDHQTLRANPVFQTITERGINEQLPLASPPTLCRLENRIKEQQLYFFADRTSCHEFLSNQFRLVLSSAAYVLMETLRRVGL